MIKSEYFDNWFGKYDSNYDLSSCDNEPVESAANEPQRPGPKQSPDGKREHGQKVSEKKAVTENVGGDKKQNNDTGFKNLADINEAIEKIKKFKKKSDEIRESKINRYDLY